MTGSSFTKHWYCKCYFVCDRCVIKEQNEVIVYIKTVTKLELSFSVKRKRSSKESMFLLSQKLIWCQKLQAVTWSCTTVWQKEDSGLPFLDVAAPLGTITAEDLQANNEWVWAYYQNAIHERHANTWAK